MSDMAGRVVDRAGNVLHEGRSRGHFAANTLGTVATADTAGIANIADTEHPRTERSRGHIPVPEGWGRPRQAD